MRTMFAMGFQPAKRAFFLGQALAQADRDHYLTAITRALSEADEIDAWLKANPTVKLNLPPPTTPPSGLSVSPYYTKYYNFLPVRPDMQKLKDRLLNADPTTWTSLTSDEHTTFGWVDVVDQVFSAFKADPINLTVGVWQGGTRQPDATVTGAAAAPANGSITIPIINAVLPPTIAGIPTKTVLIGGGVAVGLVILTSIL